MKKLIVLVGLVFSLNIIASTGWSGRVVSSTGWSGKIVSESMSEFVKKSILKEYDSTCFSAYKIYNMPVLIDVVEIRNTKSLSSDILNLSAREFEVSMQIFNSQTRSYEQSFVEVAVSYDPTYTEYNLVYLGDFEMSCY